MGLDSYFTIIEIIVVASGALVAIVTTLWKLGKCINKRFVQPVMTVVHTHKEVVCSIEIIKKEVVTNGGKSLKDTVNSLKVTCENIEINQKVIAQRARASLHYNDEALFELDREGKLVWTNEAFFVLTGQKLTDLQGFDWIVLIKEDERSDFLEEFNSCLDMNRKIEIDTISSDDELIRLIGHPYKISDSEHKGFLINISYLNEKGEKDE